MTSSRSANRDGEQITRTPEQVRFTPGPWKIFWAKDAFGKEKSHLIIGIGELNGEGVADCGFGVWRGGSDEAIANARLIAAAPELFEALSAVVADILDYERVNNLAPNPGKQDCWQSVTCAKAALSKATGGQHE